MPSTTKEGTSKKICVVGGVASGKSRLLRELTDPNNQITETYYPTTGIDLCLKRSASYTFQFWDIGGHENESALRRVYFKNTDAFIVTVDLSHKKPELELQRASVLIDDLRRHAGPHIPIIIAGTKADAKTTITKSKLQQFASQKKIERSVCTSAKNHEGLAQLEMYLNKSMPETLSPKEQSNKSTRTDEKTPVESKRLQKCKKRYDTFWDAKDINKSVIKVLDDYAKDNSTVKLFFTGHLLRDRTNTFEVNKILKDMKKNQSPTDASLCDALNKIERLSKKSQGSLDDRLFYLKEKLRSSLRPEVFATLEDSNTDKTPSWIHFDRA